MGSCSISPCGRPFSSHGTPHSLTHTFQVTCRLLFRKVVMFDGKKVVMFDGKKVMMFDEGEGCDA